VLIDPENTIDAATQGVSSGVDPWMPPGIPAAMANANWGDPVLMAGIIAWWIGKLFSD
jgi:hypothetical protein